MVQAYIKAIASYLPEAVRINDPNNRLTKKTGIYKRHVANENECASDLAIKAAERLIKKFQVDRKEIDFIILCTQSPDYFLPSTACILQQKLALSTFCGAFDFNLGCSGYVYGLSLAKGLIETNQAKCILLITAETYSKYINLADKVTESMFGDGATATLVCREETNAAGIYGSVFGTDGNGAKHLIVPAGGSRNSSKNTEKVQITDERGNSRSNYDLYMNGSEITNFALDVVPKTMNSVLEKSKLTKNQIDYYVFHQANQFMLKYLREKCQLLDNLYWNSQTECGNTVSSSIPLALEEILATAELENLKRVMLLGFGVGLSWGGCIVDLSHYQKLEVNSR